MSQLHELLAVEGDLNNAATKMANAMSWSSGEPGLEIAGTTVSVCATDPAFAARFAKHGNEAIIDSERGVYDAMMNGCLSYRTKTDGF